MVDWDVMNRAKQIISVQCYLNNIFGLLSGANLVVITADAVHGGRGGGGGQWLGGGGGVIERIVLWPLITVKT